MRYSRDTLAFYLVENAMSDGSALIFDGYHYSHRDLINQAAIRVGLARSINASIGNAHVGILIDNAPEYVFWLCAAIISGNPIVALNPKHSADAIAEQIELMGCAFIITQDKYQHLVSHVESVYTIESDEYNSLLDAAAEEPFIVLTDGLTVSGNSVFVFVFTSGTTGKPKAVKIDQKAGLFAGRGISGTAELQPDTDTIYNVMPLCHSNSIYAGFSVAIYSRCPMVLRSRFSASKFIEESITYNATYFNYTGNILRFILSTPPSDADKDCPLRIAFGNEAMYDDIISFETRFGTNIFDSYGQSELGATIIRTPDTPVGSIGVGLTYGVCIMNRETMEECPRATFDANKQLSNADVSLGEIANVISESWPNSGNQHPDFYYRNPEENANKTQGGIFWTGDMGYRDENGYFYFAGRSIDLARVNGENISMHAIDKILHRFINEQKPQIKMAASYSVKNSDSPGDSIIYCFMCGDPQAEADYFDVHDFVESYLPSQSDYCGIYAPHVLRFVEEIPLTNSMKLLRREIADTHVGGQNGYDVRIAV